MFFTMCIRLNLKRICLIGVVGTLLLNSCGQSDDYNFESDTDAVEHYEKYLEKIRDTKTCETEDMISVLNKWREEKDTVYKYLQKDKVFENGDFLGEQFININDSIKFEMIRLAETWRYSYNDVIKIREKTSPFRDDEELKDAVHEAEPFFISLDTASLYNAGKNDLLYKYRYFLKKVDQVGVNNIDELKMFIRQEDKLFRSFLKYIYIMQNEPVADITENTGKICKKIFLSAKHGNISAKDVIIYMSMRTVRRLLQNSTVCVKEINTNKMQNKAQCDAYLWMILQPFMAIDQFSIATLTDHEREAYQYVMEQLPKSTRFARAFNIEMSTLSYLLPQQLLKMYILTL